MTFWFPQVPVWMWSIGFCLVLLYFNSRSVHSFGTVEFWFALIKVTRSCCSYSWERRAFSAWDCRPRACII